MSLWPRIAQAASQPSDAPHGVDFPFVLLVTGFITALLMLAGWALSLERRKLDKEEAQKTREMDRMDAQKVRDEDRKDFQNYSSKLESRLQAMHTDTTARILKLYDIGKEERTEILTEIKELRQSFRHVESCPYLDDKQRVEE